MAVAGMIFDCDDTLVDSLWMWRSVVPEVYSRYWDGDIEAMQRRGEHMGMDEAIGMFVEETGIDATPAQIKNEMLERVHYMYGHDVKAFPGVVEVLDALRDADVPLAVCSCTDLGEVVTCLKANDLQERFVDVVSASLGYPGKNRPDIFEAARKVLDTPREATWVVDDSLVACTTAHEAGFPVIGVCWEKSGGDPEAMAKVADIVVTDWEAFDVEAFLGQGR